MTMNHLQSAIESSVKLITLHTEGKIGQLS